MNDERQVPDACRGRRRMLSRLTLLAATQLAASEPRSAAREPQPAAFRCTRQADGTLVVTPTGETGYRQAPRPGWATAA
jgi:hypothetical protein